MITIPMTIETDIIEVDMTIGAEYAISSADEYEGEYTVTPKAHEEQTLETKDKLMAENVTVVKIPYYETSNVFDGLTVFIAEDING